MKAFKRRVILAVVVLLTVMGLVAPQAALALDLHEDPDAARTVFSGIWVFRYYSTSLDLVLSQNPGEVRARLEKMPFANVPRTLDAATTDFASSIISVSGLVSDITSGIEDIRKLGGQSRSGEAAQLGREALDKISQAYFLLDSAERDVVISGRELKATSAPEGSQLKTAYNDVLARIDKIRRALDLEKDTLAVLSQEIAAAGKSRITARITLRIEPATAFVGDDVHFEGELTTAGGEALGGRQVLILAGGLQAANVVTDAGGKYRGMFSVPRQYVPELMLQALYNPGGTDAGAYASSISPGLRLKVLFYAAGLKLAPVDKAFPGRETRISGTFDYGQSPPANVRTIEVYLDDVFVMRTSVQPTFDINLKLDPNIEPGRHVVSISTVVAGRYAPVVSGARLEVSKAQPLLELDVPGMAMIPGVVSLSGRLYSELGPVGNAPVGLKMGNSGAQVETLRDGTFFARINLGPDMGLVEWRDIQVSVAPGEPWHAPLKETRSMLAVNWVNCGGFLGALVFLGIYLPKRLRRKLGMRPVKPAKIPSLPQAEPAVAAAVIPVAAEDAEREDSSPGGKIFNWYRLIVRRILKLTKVSLLPRQTLREFAAEVKEILGPAGQSFLDLTGMVERLLYSRQGATEADAERGQHLYRNIEQETGGLQFAVRAISVAGEEVLSQLGSVPGKLAAGTSVAAQAAAKAFARLNTWLWVMLFLAVVYYAVLLYMLSLMISR